MKRFTKIVQLFLIQTHWAVWNEEVCQDCSVIPSFKHTGRYGMKRFAKIVQFFPPSNTLGGMD